VKPPSIETIAPVMGGLLDAMGDQSTSSGSLFPSGEITWWSAFRSAPSGAEGALHRRRDATRSDGVHAYAAAEVLLGERAGSWTTPPFEAQ
jgi:hypothetical protein